MGIPATQLATWTSLGATQKSAAAYASIRAALEASANTLSPSKYNVYLQGSYANATNIYADSDVDVVVELSSCWNRDLTAMPPGEQLAYQQVHSPAVYNLTHFRQDVLKALRTYYGPAAVEEGNKCVEVNPTSGRFSADVIVCVQYRRYQHFYSIDTQEYVCGISFNAQRDGRLVINYPKLHSINGSIKNNAQHTNEYYKPSVRMFKNARNCATERGLIAEGSGPSYFLECLLYNVSDKLFGNSFSDTYFNVIDFLNIHRQLRTDWSRFVCQNEQRYLFGAEEEQWSIEAAYETINGLARLWDEW